jgi:HEAT repeats
MEENLEIYFCEICSESIPATDLASRAALEVKGKVIGPCCLNEVQRPQSGKAAGMSPAGLTALGAVVLAAIAGATIHLEWRLSDEISLLTTKVEEVEVNVASSGSRSLADLQRGLDGTMQKGELKPVLDRLDVVEGKVTGSEKALGMRLDVNSARLSGFEKKQDAIISGQGNLKSEIKEVTMEIMRLERDIAAAAAAPRGAIADASTREPRNVPSKDGDKAEPGTGLPPALGHQVTRLKAGDAGDRFEAVDVLVQSKNVLALPHLLPMLKDEDAFVRRLTAEGLASFRDKTAVDALLVSMADPEGIVRHTAHASLRKLTGQSIAFDPDGSGSARSQSQRRWKDWWDKNRDKF